MEKSKVFIKKICLYLQFDIHSKTCNAKIRMNRSFPFNPAVSLFCYCGRLLNLFKVFEKMYYCWMAMHSSLKAQLNSLI